jgi:hypothetical protein
MDVIHDMDNGDGNFRVSRTSELPRWLALGLGTGQPLANRTTAPGPEKMCRTVTVVVLLFAPLSLFEQLHYGVKLSSSSNGVASAVRA